MAYDTDIYSLPVLEGTSLNSRCRQGHTLSEGASRGSVFVSLASRVAGFFGVSWLVDVSLQSLLLSSHGLLPYVSVFLSKFPSSYKDTSHIGFKPHSNPVSSC